MSVFSLSLATSLPLPPPRLWYTRRALYFHVYFGHFSKARVIQFLNDFILCGRHFYPPFSLQERSIRWVPAYRVTHSFFFNSFHFFPLVGLHQRAFTFSCTCSVHILLALRRKKVRSIFTKVNRNFLTGSLFLFIKLSCLLKILSLAELCRCAQVWLGTPRLVCVMYHVNGMFG